MIADLELDIEDLEEYSRQNKTHSSKGFKGRIVLNDTDSKKDIEAKQLNVWRSKNIKEQEEPEPNLIPIIEPKVKPKSIPKPRRRRYDENGKRYFSKEHRQKMRENMLNAYKNGTRKPRIGIPHTKEAREKISQRIKERGGFAGKNNPRWGRKNTKKINDAISKANSKPVMVEGREFKNLTAASIEVRISKKRLFELIDNGKAGYKFLEKEK